MIDHKTITPEEEYKIVQECLKDPREFRLIYDLYYYDVFRFVHNRINEPNLTADIVSEIFYKAITKLESYKYQGYSIKPWLLRISHNEVINHFRQNKKERTVSMEKESFPELAMEMETIEKLDVTMLIPALDNLSTEELSLIEFKFFERLTYIEIAEIVGVSVSNARVKTHRVINKMRDFLVNKQ